MDKFNKYFCTILGRGIFSLGVKNNFFPELIQELANALLVRFNILKKIREIKIC